MAKDLTVSYHHWLGSTWFTAAFRSNSSSAKSWQRWWKIVSTGCRSRYLSIGELMVNAKRDSQQSPAPTSTPTWAMENPHIFCHKKWHHHHVGSTQLPVATCLGPLPVHDLSRSPGLWKEIPRDSTSELALKFSDEGPKTLYVCNFQSFT